MGRIASQDHPLASTRVALGVVCRHREIRHSFQLNVDAFWQLGGRLEILTGHFLGYRAGVKLVTPLH